MAGAFLALRVRGDHHDGARVRLALMKAFGLVITAIYRALHTDRPSGHGASAWFIRELEARSGVIVSRATMSSWLKNGVPEARQQAVDDVLQMLHAEAHARIASQLAELEALDGVGTES